MLQKGHSRHCLEKCVWPEWALLVAAVVSADPTTVRIQILAPLLGDTVRLGFCRSACNVVGNKDNCNALPSRIGSTEKWQLAFY